MNKRRRNILLSVVFILIGIAAATTLALKAFEENLLYFYSPSQIAAGEAPNNRIFRIGGLVVPNTVKRDPDNLKVSFILSDMKMPIVFDESDPMITVYYEGILPDLFREGQGIVANGVLARGPSGDLRIEASEVLAKHDENYMPTELADAAGKDYKKLEYSDKQLESEN